MTTLYERPGSLAECATHYCAGCGHGILHRLIAEVIDELGISGRTIGLAPVGCAVLAHQYLKFDMCEPAHGRTAAVATGIKRVRPECVVFSYQGDGDLAAIGLAETVHAANRGEAISVFFVNNAVYGMTGGQMAPTTLLKQRTTTTPGGRDASAHGYPIRVCEMLDTLDAPLYIERIALTSPQQVLKARRAIRKSFVVQIEHKGYSLVEFLSPCPTHFKMSPSDSLRFVAEDMSHIFPPKLFRDKTAEQPGEGRPHRA
ncbi:2-oxoglutarate oxidoreductase [bacterium]|nr:2-oxoglutarate oxidoreductase [bacterium]